MLKKYEMKKIYHCLLICIFSFTSCKKVNEKVVKTAVVDSTNHEPILNDTVIESEDVVSDYELNYVVCVSESDDYNTLKNIAVETSELLKIKFDTLDRYYNTSKKKIIVPENIEDEMWAGEYLFRRYGDDFVSIEMKSVYIDTLTEKDEIKAKEFNQDSTKMFVCAGLFKNKQSADSLLKILKPKYDDAQIIPSNIYVGCMH